LIDSTHNVQIVNETSRVKTTLIDTNAEANRVNCKTELTAISFWHLIFNFPMFQSMQQSFHYPGHTTALPILDKGASTFPLRFLLK